MQRWRLKFTRGEELKYISHLDLMRLWERLLRRAGVPLAYSQGFSPHPRLSLAAPLAVGITSGGELLEFWLSRPLPRPLLLQAVRAQAPPGLEIQEATSIPLAIPSLPSQVQAAEYLAEGETDKGQEEVAAAIQTFLATQHLPWQHHRDTGARHYDLRPLVEGIWLEEWRGPGYCLGMRLRCDNTGSGRPEQVVAALGLPRPQRLHRTRLIFGPR